MSSRPTLPSAEEIGALVPIGRIAKQTPYSVDFLRQLARVGKLRAYKLHRDWLTTPDAVHDYIKSQTKRHEKALSVLQAAEKAFLAVALLLVVFSVTPQARAQSLSNPPPGPGTVSATLHNLSADWRDFALFYQGGWNGLKAEQGASLRQMSDQLVFVCGTINQPFAHGWNSLVKNVGLLDDYATNSFGTSNSTFYSRFNPPHKSYAAATGRVLGASTTVQAPTTQQPLSLSYIQHLITQTFQSMATAGQLTGPQGPQGAQGAQGPAGASASSIVNNQNGNTTATIGGNPIVTYVPPVASDDFSGTTLSGFGELSANSFTSGNATINGNLNVSGPISVSSLTTSGNAAVGGTLTAATSTLSSLTVSGSATFSGSTTIAGLTVTGFNPGLTLGSVAFQGAAGLSQDNSNFFYDATDHRLGLGTTTPSQLLTVAGDALITGNATASQLTDLGLTSGDCLQAGTGGLLQSASGACGSGGGANYWISASNALFNNTGYKVGINSSTPSANLMVEGSNTAPTIPIFTVASSSGSSFFTVLANGSVGIGTTTPAFPLDVNGDIDTYGNYRYGSQVILNAPSTTNNLFIGLGAGNLTATGTDDTAIGYDAGSSLTVPGSSANPQAGQHITTARESTIIGYDAGNALVGNDTGVEDSIDTFVGSMAGLNEMGGYNVYVGQKAGLNSASSSGSIFIGVHAGASFNSGSENIIIGHSAANNNASTTGSNNVVIGGGALGGVSGGTVTANVLIGQYAGFSLSTSSDNTMIGNAVGYNNVNGNNNTYLGFEAGNASVASNNTFLGYSAGAFNTSGIDETFVGYDSGLKNTSGLDNTCLGYNSCATATSTGDITAFGSGAGSQTTAQNDVFGYTAGGLLTTGASNAIFGDQAGHALTTQSDNAIFGYEAGDSEASNGNTLMGYKAGVGASTGLENTLIGSQAGYNITTGTRNIIIGADHNPLDPLTTGSNNIIIGHTMGPVSSSTSNSLDIGNLIYGNNLGTGTTTPVTNGLIGIGTISPTSTLFVQGSGSTNPFAVASSTGTQLLTINPAGNLTASNYPNCSGFTTNSNGLVQCTASDERLKQNITPLGSESGLAALNALSPVSFYWQDPTRGTTEQFELIAQQVQQIFPNLVSTTTPTALTPNGTLTLNYDGLISPLILATQELSASSTALQSSLQVLQNQVSNLQNSLGGNASSSDLTMYVPSNFSGDSVGEAEIPGGQTAVRVPFSQPYAYQPIVTLTPTADYIGHFWVGETDSSGFTIEIDQPDNSPLVFNWHSFASPTEQLTVSGASTQPIMLVVATSTPASEPLALSADSTNSSTETPTQPGSLATSTPDALGTSTPASAQDPTDSTTIPSTASSSVPSVVAPTPTPTASAIPTPPPTPSPAPTAPPADASTSATAVSASGP